MVLPFQHDWQLGNEVIGENRRIVASGLLPATIVEPMNNLTVAQRTKLTTANRKALVRFLINHSWPRPYADLLFGMARSPDLRSMVETVFAERGVTNASVIPPDRDPPKEDIEHERAIAAFLKLKETTLPLSHYDVLHMRCLGQLVASMHEKTICLICQWPIAVDAPLHPKGWFLLWTYLKTEAHRVLNKELDVRQRFGGQMGRERPMVVDNEGKPRDIKDASASKPELAASIRELAEKVLDEIEYKIFRAVRYSELSLDDIASDFGMTTTTLQAKIDVIQTKLRDAT